MPIIQTGDLSKVFRVPNKDPGLRGAVKARFKPHRVEEATVGGVSFAVEPGESVRNALFGV